MKTQRILQIILTILALHLLYSNSALLRQLVHSQSTIATVFSVLFGLSYSLITVLIIAIYPRWYVFTVSGLLDSVAVLLKYYPFGNEQLFFVLTAIYFAVYTGYIVVISGIISRRENERQSAKTNASDNGHFDLDGLLQKRSTLLRSIPRIKDPYTKQLKQRELEEIEKVIKEVSN